MAMNRRDTFKLAGVAAAVVAVPSMATAAEKKAPEKKAPAKKAGGKSVVVIGGGFGGLTIAKALRKLDKTIEVTVIEKNNVFMACPFSNTLLGGLDNVTLDNFVGDYYQPSATYGYSFVNATVTAIDKAAKTVTTTEGSMSYDILVLSPGIAYDYAGQFPKWSKEKIAEVAQACPAGLIPGNEHIALKRQMENMDDGNIIIVPPAKGKFRCPPAPYERTSMVANYMKKEGIKGKVIVLDNKDGAFAKGAAFKEAWADIFPDIIEYKGLTDVTDIDTKAKTITYTEYANVDDEKGVVKTEKYQVCNLMPNNICSPVITMAGIKANAQGFAMMDGMSFRSVSDKNIYVIGDAVSHGIPPSGQTAIWCAHKAAGQITDQLNGKANDPTAGYPATSANVCFSMVNGKPEEAIMVTHTFTAGPNGTMTSEGSVPKPKDGNGKFRSGGTAKATREWFGGVMREMFA
jgi:NADPH-dependent 2,4-dienoyl-CoA reductase/sulfur reductase-like enzyme